MLYVIICDLYIHIIRQNIGLHRPQHVPGIGGEFDGALLGCLCSTVFDRGDLRSVSNCVLTVMGVYIVPGFTGDGDSLDAVYVPFFHKGVNSQLGLDLPGGETFLPNNKN